MLQECHTNPNKQEEACHVLQEFVTKQISAAAALDLSGEYPW
jgi:hypothetical protein